jgi:hypothetical protein
MRGNPNPKQPGPHKLWTDEEKDIIREFYPIEGKSCAKRLPGRTEEAVRKRACLIGVRYTGNDFSRSVNNAFSLVHSMRWV